MSDLNAAFHQAMLSIYTESAKLGYRPARLLQMINESGGVQTAHAILSQADITLGFEKLWELNRFDLTVEALVLKPEFASLFHDDERREARRRLTEVGYTPSAAQCLTA